MSETGFSARGILVRSIPFAAWFPTDIEGERAAGAPLRFVFRNGEGPTIDGKMLTYDPPSVLEFRWGNDETLRFDLKPDGDGTTLTFVNTFHALGKAARDACSRPVLPHRLPPHARSSTNQRTIATVAVMRFGSLRKPWPSSGNWFHRVTNPRPPPGRRADPERHAGHHWSDPSAQARFGPEYSRRAQQSYHHP
jgi:hypothetical protein